MKQDLPRSADAMARMAGVFYLVLAVVGVYSFSAETNITAYDGLNLADTILSSKTYFRSGMLSELIMGASWLLAATTLAALFEKTNRAMALGMAGMVIAGTAVIFIKITCQLAAILLLESGAASGLDAAQLTAQANPLYDIVTTSMYANFIFIGGWLFPFAYFIYASGSFPKRISRPWAALVALAGIAYFVDVLTFFLDPVWFFQVANYLFPADLFSIYWLLFRGAQTDRN